ncbi:MAG: hypothetical protein R3F43_11095 [bacterium]
MPSAAGPVVLLDMGANVDCRASHLVQFALMGAAYASATLGKSGRPWACSPTAPSRPRAPRRCARPTGCSATPTCATWATSRDAPSPRARPTSSSPTASWATWSSSSRRASPSPSSICCVRLKGDWLGGLGAA